jgi:fucose 4-O-acetylase-like acetyltransferase
LRLLNEERIEYIDIARGIGILLVVLGHSVGYIDNPLNRWILSFHMPLFFFLTGLLSKRRVINLRYFKRKVETILLPQCVMALLTITFSLVVECLILHQIRITEVKYIEAIFFWFLPVLFVSTVLFQIILNCIPEDRRLYLYFVAIFIMVIAVLIECFQVQTPVHIEIVSMAMFFMTCGQIFGGSGFRVLHAMGALQSL